MKEHTRHSVPIPGRNSHTLALAHTLPASLDTTTTRAALVMTTMTVMGLSMATNIKIRDMQEARC